MLNDFVLVASGHIIIAINNFIRIVLGKNKNPHNDLTELDKTGRVVSRAIPIRILHRDKNIIFALYENLIAHSFWRSQELSLFMQNRNFLAKPVIDFGCGDGSFSAVIFSQVDYGADIDKQALEVAKEYNLYEQTVLIPMDNYILPVESETIGSVYSNSVLEHVSDLEATLSEIHRVLKPDGIFMFTVPVKQFAMDLTKYFGKKESIRINKLFYHRNLLNEREWLNYVEKRGFEIIKVIHYQPSWFTFMNRILLVSGCGRLSQFIILRFWAHINELMIKSISLSIVNKNKGGNIFVVVRKKPAI